MIVSNAYDYDWKSLIEEQQASGLNMKAFCRERDLPYQSFKNHKRALQGDETKTFLPVKQKEARTLCVTINGNAICFDSDTEDSDISRILKAMMV